jgi:hypothetical protein
MTPLISPISKASSLPQSPQLALDVSASLTSSNTIAAGTRGLFDQDKLIDNSSSDSVISVSNEGQRMFSIAQVA